MTVEELRELRVRIHDLNVELRKARETIAGHEALFQEIGRREGRTARKFQRMRDRLKEEEEARRREQAAFTLTIDDAVAAMRAAEGIQGHDKELAPIERFLLVYG